MTASFTTRRRSGRDEDLDVTVNPTAASGFDSGAEAYERGRPSYPKRPSLRRRVLGLGPGKRCSTSQQARQDDPPPRPDRVELVAVEPVAGMRTVFAAAVPSVEILDGTAEALPLRRCLGRRVVVAQRFTGSTSGKRSPRSTVC